MNILIVFIVKTHAKRVTESVIDVHIDKKRGLCMELWKIVTYTLEWTTSSFVRLTKRENDKWNFIKKHGSSYSTYLQRLHEKFRRVPFFWIGSSAKTAVENSSRICLKCHFLLELVQLLRFNFLPLIISLTRNDVSD